MNWEQTHVNGTRILSRDFGPINYGVKLSDGKLLEFRLTGNADSRTYSFNPQGRLTRAVVGDVQYDSFIPPEVRLDSGLCNRLLTLPKYLIDPNNLESCITHLEKRSYS